MQLASYRDTELPLTIASALESARYPERVTFGICWQYDNLTLLDLDGFINDPRFRIDAVHYTESRGCCWARNRTNLMYGGEEYTLQIDAHTRFDPDWDERYIVMLESLGVHKPVLSTYPAPFEYIDGRESRYRDHGMQKLVLNRMRSDLTTVFKSVIVSDDSKPASSAYLGAGQIFAHGSFCRDVEYDPELYFAGEEINLSVRAYTWGYDFFCPNEDLIWHYYQHTMPLHSMDHQSNQHKQAVSRLRELLVGDPAVLGKYGLGPHRSRGQFELEAGINFRERLGREDEPCRFTRSLEVELPQNADVDDVTHFDFTLMNVDNRGLYRQQISAAEIGAKGKWGLQLDEYLEDVPVGYQIRAFSRSLGEVRGVSRDLE